MTDQNWEAQAIEALGGLKAYKEFTLERYDNKAAIEKCAAYPGRNLYLWGRVGTGKTHLATALVRRLEGRVVKPQQIYRSCRGLISSTEEQAVINGYINTPYLVIDDLGVEKNTTFSLSTLYEIIDGRDLAYQAGLIVTSNLSLGELAERIGDDRLTSRLAGLCQVVELSGRDRRMDKSKGA